MTERSQSDRRWVLGFALFLVLLTSLPYLIAILQQDSDWVFSGFLFGVEDGHSYIAKMLRGAQGEWLFRSPYSTLAQRGALVYLPFLVLGKSLGPNAAHSHTVSAFHLFRAVSIIVLCFAIYDFAAVFLAGRGQRRLALTLATLGGGLGWLLLATGQLPLDFYSPETFGFLAIFGLPHLVLARALLLWGLLRYLNASAGKTGWCTALLWLALALTHQLSAAVGLLLVAAHLIFSRVLHTAEREIWGQALREGGWALVGALPILAINAVQYLGDPFLQGWVLQNRIPSPPPWHYLLAYGLLLVFAVWGARQLYRRDAWKAGLLIAWMAMLPILLYLPLGLQRRLAEGAWVVLIVLALGAFEGNRGRRLVWRWSFLSLLPSTLILLVGSLKIAQTPRQPAFLPAGQVAAFKALGSLAEFDQVVLTSYPSGTSLPAWVPLRVVVGHGPETVGLAGLFLQVEAFYQAPTDYMELLVEWGVDYVFVGPAERSLAGGSFSAPSGLALIYAQADFQIYTVITSPAD